MFKSQNQFFYGSSCLKLILSLGLIFICQACIDDSVVERSRESEAGEMASGDNLLNVAGKMMAGEITAGEITAGEMLAGENTAGEITAGEMLAGEDLAGENTAGEPLPANEDTDNDGILNQDDNCPLAANNSQGDRDDDGRGDVCDNCPDVANFDQADADLDGVGDACEAFQDSDNDGIFDLDDNCPNQVNPGQSDNDDDGIGNRCDNCPNDANFDQADSDLDGTGDLCDEIDTPVIIQLNWENAQLDFDLHLINPRGVFFSRESDCWSTNQSPNWALPGLSGDAPQNGETQETISINEPSAGWHTVAVDLFTGRSSVTGTALLSLACNGASFAFGPQEITSENNTNRSMWQVFRFDPSTCEIEEISSVNAVTCSGNRATSCECTDCDQGPCSLCPEEASCDPTSGECNDLCADVTCDPGSLCNQTTGACDSAQCLPCENESDCPDGSYCIVYTLQNVQACAVTCEANSDCDVGQTCSQVIRDRQIVNVCADLENACQPDLCESVNCEAGSYCDPSDGNCVTCVTNDQCAEGEACVDQECLNGAERSYSSWGNGNELPSCDQCTSAETCQDPRVPFTGQFCALECDENLACPQGLTCCNVDNIGSLNGSLCVDPRNSLADFVCGG